NLSPGGRAPAPGALPAFGDPSVLWRCTIRRLTDFLGFATAFTAGTLLVIASVVVFLQVVFRYFLYMPLAWAEESARFLFIWVALLGAALGVKDRAHFAITMMVARFPRQIREVVRVAIALSGSYIFYIMITEGWMLVLLNRNQESPAIGLVMSVPYLVIPISGLLMLYFTWADLIMHWTGKGSPGASAEEPSGPLVAD
ncbi:MAG: TRAP transporter small permease, partial [Chloroflexota bacterium]